MINLTCTLRITKVLKKSKAEGFKKLQEGDIITIDAPLVGAGRRKDGAASCYAQEVVVECEAKNVSVVKSFSQASNIIYNFFELEEA